MNIVDNATRDRWGFTLLMRACLRGEAEVVRLLLANGADPESQNQIGQNALMLACIEGRLEVVRLLLAKTDVRARRRAGQDGADVCMSWRNRKPFARQWSRIEAQGRRDASHAGQPRWACCG